MCVCVSLFADIPDALVVMLIDSEGVPPAILAATTRTSYVVPGYNGAIVVFVTAPSTFIKVVNGIFPTWRASTR